jgi:GNAT superfamily N-acetyltransferase
LGVRPRSVFQLERRVGYIHGLVVDQEHRRTGCGAMLIEHVKQAASQEGIALLGIDFWSFNDAGRACFGKAGFKVGREFMWLGL